MNGLSLFICSYVKILGSPYSCDFINGMDVPVYKHECGSATSLVEKLMENRRIVLYIEWFISVL